MWAEKGGVGKTSICLALSKSLAKTGQRVLMVDLDSQASLTRLCLLPGLKKGRSEDEIKTAYLQLIKGRSLHESFDRFLPSATLPEDFPDPLPAGEEGLWIVPGEADTSNLDFHLALAQGLYPFMPFAVSYWGAVRAMIEKFALRVKASYVVLDCNPSSSMLNRILMFSSDFWLPVLLPDFLSEQPIDSMTDRLTKPSSVSLITKGDWVEEAHALGQMTQGLAITREAHGPDRKFAARYPFRGMPPCYLGTVMNKSSSADETNPYEKSIVTRLESFVKTLESKKFKCAAAVAVRIPLVKSKASFPLFEDESVIRLFDEFATRILKL